MTVPLDDSQDPMPPDTATVSGPVVSGVKPVQDENEPPTSSVLGRVNSQPGLHDTPTDDPESDEMEPFLLHHRSYDEVNEYDEGFHCRQTGGQNDDTNSGMATWMG
jgi:hypothetical protein